MQEYQLDIFVSFYEFILVLILRIPYRLFPRLNLSVELTHTSNMRFMKFDAGIVETIPDDDETNEEAWKRKSVKVSNRRS